MASSEAEEGGYVGTEPVEAQQIVVYGAAWCPDCRRAKQFLGDQRVQYCWVDLDRDMEALAYVEEINAGRRAIPTIVFPDGTVLTEPSNAELARQLGLATRAERSFYDVIIIGGGPCGLTAGFYLAREGIDTLLIERSAPGGQASVSEIIENFPGFDEGISGDEFARRLTNQARRFGVEILPAQEVSELRVNGKYREVVTDDGAIYGANAVLVASGAYYRMLGVPGEQELTGINIHVCATCDGPFYQGKELLVIGGGNSAFEEALSLTRWASQITIMTRSQRFKASSILQEQVAERSDIKTYAGHHVLEFMADAGRLAGVKVRDEESGEEKVWRPDGVFIYIGMQPHSAFLPPEIERERFGFIVTDKTLQTSLKGVFAAGDVRAGATHQAAAAAGEGATAALMIRDYLQSLI